MFWSRRPKKTPAPFDLFAPGLFHVVYAERSIPGDQSSLRFVYLTEQLPVEQLVGPAFENRVQNQTVRRMGEVSAAVQGVGLLGLADHSNEAGTFRLSPLTDISSIPGGIPVVADGAIGAFELGG